MLEQKIISPKELAKFGNIETLNEQAKSLVVQQQATWELAAKNYAALKNIQTRTFDFDRFKIVAQFNPGRIRSSAAKTDEQSIAERPCFLCVKNLPDLQKGILFQNRYLVLTNPYPVFTQHLTLAHLQHTAQRIKNHFVEMLEFSAALPDFTVFYNGPQCGASAPDHFHFQAGLKGLLPIESEYEILEKDFAEMLFQNKNSKVIAAEQCLRRFVSIVSSDKNRIQTAFENIYQTLETGGQEEPMMNILCNFMEGYWRLIIFPREKQRPTHFFRTDGKQLIVSPAAVELSGILILPRKEDFEKITKREVEEIYDEVVINKESFEQLKQALKHGLSSLR